MLRIVVFLGVVLGVVACIGALNWWMDPFNDRYHPDALTTALTAAPHPCLLSQEVIGDGATADFKWDLVRRKQPRVVVFGSSRAGRFAARQGENAFVNMTVPAFDPRLLPALFAKLASLDHAPVTVYIGAEAFWFNPRFRGAFPFGRSWRSSLDLWLSPQTMWQTLHLLRRAPGAIRHPRALRTAQRFDGPHGCVLDSGDSVYGGAAQAWGPDGSLYLPTELSQTPANHPEWIVENRGKYAGTAWDAGVERGLDRALGTARSHGWRVVGFSPTYSRTSLRRLRHDSAYARLWALFERRAPRIFRRRGYPFVDLSDPRRVRCAETDFLFGDGAHPDDACTAKERRILDTARARQPSPR